MAPFQNSLPVLKICSIHNVYRIFNSGSVYWNAAYILHALNLNTKTSGVCTARSIN